MRMDVLSVVAVVLDVAVLLAFVWALISLRRIPVGRRPRVTVYNRAGRPIKVEELDPPDLPGD